MFSLPGHQIGDAWYFTDNNTIHAFFLVKPLDSQSGWDIGHAVSPNLVDWQYRGLALSRGPDSAWDGKSLATGSVIRRGDLYWMAYTGHKKDEDYFVQRIGMAFSHNLERWEKLDQNPTSVADERYYELVSTGQRDLTHWRDPFLLDNGDHLIQYTCARRTDGDSANRGTVGLARSADLSQWEILPPLEHDPITEEMEVPQVYAIDGRYYLLFCTHSHLLDPAFVERFPDYPFRSADYAMVGDSPLGPFYTYGTGEILLNPPPYSFYASQLVPFKDEWFLLGTIRDNDGTKLSDPLPIVASETGLYVK